MNQIEQLATQFQDDCHETAQFIMEKLPNCSHQDATNVWIFKKLAELQFQINNSGMDMMPPKPQVNLTAEDYLRR